MVDISSQCDVFLRDAAGVMRCEDDLDLVVDVGPFGVVVHLFGLQGDAGHEAEGGVEVSEFVGLGDGVPAGCFRPSRQAGDGLRRSDALCHVAILLNALTTT